MERSLESWEEMQRHGQGIAERFNSLAQGIGCMLHSHIRTTGEVQQDWKKRMHWPWPWPQGRISRVGFDFHKPGGLQQTKAPEFSSAFYDLGQRLGQAGAGLGACVQGFFGQVAKQFHRPAAANLSSAAAAAADISVSNGTLEWNTDRENGGIVISSSRQRRAEEATANSADLHDGSDDLFAVVSKSQGQFHKQNVVQSSVAVTTTYDSRTQDIETSVVARGDLWRAEASHGGTTSSPLFLLQIGPILFVRDTTLLLPIHLSKQHLLWYGFDRKNGLHSLCPAVWSKHRRWLMMSMICLNPLTCSFMDIQFPNGQMTYVAGEGLNGSAFLPLHGGIVQVQGRYPGETKLSFSYKNKWGTRICPVLQVPERSLSVGLTQPLAWQRSCVMLRPTVQLSVTPTFGGRNSGWRAEVTHSPKEKLSFACGCAFSLEPSAFASVSLGRSKRNGEHTGSSGLVFQLETPLENLRRASFSVQLNSGVEF